MTPGRPGDGSYPDPYDEDPYGRDPYGRDRYGQEDRQDVYGQDTYGQNAYGQDPYGARDAYEEGAYGARSHGGQTYGGQSHGGGAHGDGHGQAAWDPGSQGYPYEQPRGEYQTAFDALSDPLTDPLPSSGTPGSGQQEDSPSPWFRPARDQGQAPGAGQQPQQHAQPQHPAQPQQHAPPQHAQPQHPARPPQHAQPQLPQPRRPRPSPPEVGRGPADAGETVALPAVESPEVPATPRRRRAGAAAGPVHDTAADTADSGVRSAEDTEGSEHADDGSHTVALRRPSESELGGRAARRKAAAAKARGRGRGGSHGRRAAGSASDAPARPMTRLEARRAERAAKDGPVVLLSRAIGEIFITCGVLMLLFVAYQLWWTNILAHNYAGGATDSLTEKWEEHPERKPGEFSPGQGFAIMYIPKLDVVVPVAQGVEKQSVLDKGLVGHYDKSSGVPTAMPWDKKGNFGVAGHRNTHGEPFRYVNRLVAGDKIVVETAETYYVYEMYSRLPSTSPSNVSVLEAVPPQSGFEKPGRYITLTTCTPEFTSKYRLIIWGRMVDERPRSQGKPDALVE